MASVEAGLRLERDGAVAELVLARPERQNAIGRATWRALAEHCLALDADPAVRVVVVRGEPPSFSAGADIAEFAEVFADASAAHAYNELVQLALDRLERLGKPTIAQIGGSCIGGGCGLAVACDLRFAASDARFGITPAKLGLAYSLGDVRRLVNLIGPARAKDLLFSARLIDADEALRLGLIDRVVPPDELAQAGSRLCAGPADPVGQLAAADQADHRAGAWRCRRREHRQPCLARQCGRPSGFRRRATGFPGKAPTPLRVSRQLRRSA